MLIKFKVRRGVEYIIFSFHGNTLTYKLFFLTEESKEFQLYYN